MKRSLVVRICCSPSPRLARIYSHRPLRLCSYEPSLGQDVKSSAIQLGKALQDPILGVTALRRVGVNFSDAQQDVIKNLVETNQLGKAQALILKELQTEFGGSARAAGQTFSGQLTILQNTFGDLMEVVGQGVAESIAPFVKTLADF